MAPAIESAHPQQAPSARNLVDYLGLRQLDEEEPEEATAESD